MNPRPTRPGFTLIELVISLAIASVLAVAVTTAIYIATRSVPSRGDNLYTSTDLLYMNDTLRTELEMATSITNVSNHAIEFTVPDRTGDTIPETIQIGWSGVAGEPLRTRLNGGAWSTVISRVDTLTFTPVTSTKQVFAGTQTPVITQTEIDGGFTTGGWSPIFSGNRTGIQIAPSLPAGTKWRLVGVDFYLRWQQAQASDILEVSAGKAVTSVTDPWKHSVAELSRSDVQGSGSWVVVPLRTPWLADTEKVIVQLYNKQGSSTPEVRILPLTSMPQGLKVLGKLHDDWVELALTSISVKVRYETMTADESLAEVDTLAIESVKVQMGFAQGIADSTFEVRPLAQAEDLR